MRALEHRIQLHRLRRTHLMPTSEPDLRRLARSVGMRAEGADGLLERWKAAKRDVRRLHEELFYRPLLPATAQLSTEEASLSPDEARARLSAIGYLDPAGAMRHIAALTEGISRRAAIQRQLLPVMLGWFADGADPDGGLLAFRRLSDELGTTHWYLKLLRDSGTAARRLARVLSTSRYVADALTRSPESVTWLADDADLQPRSFERLTGRGRRDPHALGRPDEGGHGPAWSAPARARPDRGGRRDGDGHGHPGGPEPERRGRRRAGRAPCASRSSRRAGTGVSTRARPGCSWSRWGVGVAGRWATRRTPTSCSCTTRCPARSTSWRRSSRSRSRRRCGSCWAPSGRSPRSRSTRTCAPRAATGRWSGPSSRTPSTTTAGPRRGRARRCSGRARWPVTRAWGSGSSSSSRRCGTRRAASTRPSSVRSAGSRPASSPSGFPGASSRHGTSSSAAGASRTSSGRPSSSSCSTRTRSRTCAPPARSRRWMPRRRRGFSTPRPADPHGRMAAGVAPPRRQRALDRSWRRARRPPAARPAGAGRTGARGRVHRRLGQRARTGLPAHGSPGPRRGRAHLLRLNIRA